MSIFISYTSLSKKFSKTYTLPCWPNPATIWPWAIAICEAPFSPLWSSWATSWHLYGSWTARGPSLVANMTVVNMTVCSGVVVKQVGWLIDFTRYLSIQIVPPLFRDFKKTCPRRSTWPNTKVSSWTWISCWHGTAHLRFVEHIFLFVLK